MNRFVLAAVMCTACSSFTEGQAEGEGEVGEGEEAVDPVVVADSATILAQAEATAIAACANQNACAGFEACFVDSLVNDVRGLTNRLEATCNLHARELIADHDCSATAACDEIPNCFPFPAEEFSEELLNAGVLACFTERDVVPIATSWTCDPYLWNGGRGGSDFGCVCGCGAVDPACELGCGEAGCYVESCDVCETGVVLYSQCLFANATFDGVATIFGTSVSTFNSSGYATKVLLTTGDAQFIRLLAPAFDSVGSLTCGAGVTVNVGSGDGTDATTCTISVVEVPDPTVGGTLHLVFDAQFPGGGESSGFARANIYPAD